MWQWSCNFTDHSPSREANSCIAMQLLAPVLHENRRILEWHENFPEHFGLAVGGFAQFEPWMRYRIPWPTFSLVLSVPHGYVEIIASFQMLINSSFFNRLNTSPMYLLATLLNNHPLSATSIKIKNCWDMTSGSLVDRDLLPLCSEQKNLPFNLKMVVTVLFETLASRPMFQVAERHDFRRSNLGPKRSHYSPPMDVRHIIHSFIHSFIYSLFRICSQAAFIQLLNPIHNR
jgi:hypothetical protein